MATEGLGEMTEHDFAQFSTASPFAPLVRKLATLLGYAKYDSEHWCLLIHRSDLRLAPGQLFGVEIYFLRDRQASLHVDYVRDVYPTGATFRGTGPRPLTLRGLRRVVRQAKRLPRSRRGFALLEVVELLNPLGQLQPGQVGTVVETLDADHVLVEFAGEDGVAMAVEPVPVRWLQPVSAGVEEELVERAMKENPDLPRGFVREALASMTEDRKGAEVFVPRSGQAGALGEDLTHDQLFGHLADDEFTAPQAAEYLEVSLPAFRRLVASGKLVTSSVVGQIQMFSVTALRDVKKALKAR